MQYLNKSHFQKESLGNFESVAQVGGIHREMHAPKILQEFNHFLHWTPASHPPFDRPLTFAIKVISSTQKN